MTTQLLSTANLTAAPTRIVLVSNDPAIHASVRAALDERYQLRDQDICTDLTRLLLRLQRDAAPLVLVDLHPEPAHLLLSLEPIIARFGATRFVTLMPTDDEDVMLESMKAGARYALNRQAITGELIDVLRRVDGRAQRRPLGRIITVLSASGGCGGTTLAVNLAHELQLVSEQAALLIDMDWCHGGVAGYLGLQSQFGLADVLAGKVQIDADLVRSAARAHSDRLFALLSPASTDSHLPFTLNFDKLATTLAVCQMTYPCTIIDAPRQSMDTTAGLAALSQLTIVVLQLCVKDVRNARAMLGHLGGRGVSMDRVLLVANRCRRRHQWLSLEQAAQSLGVASIERISNDYHAAAKAINYGKPIEQVRPRSPIRKDLKRLIAEHVTAVDA